MKRKMTHRQNLKENVERKNVESKASRERETEGGSTSGLACTTPSPSRNKSKSVASKRKPDMTLNLYESEKISDSGDEYMFVHKGKLLQWARSFAWCKCGKQMALNEEKVEGMVSNFAAVCKDCRTENKFCTMEGGSLNGGYNIHKKIVKSTLESGNGYVGGRGLFVAFNMLPLSETSYYKIASR